MSLVYYDRWMGGSAARAARPGRRFGRRVRAAPGSGRLSPARWLALLIATGIGLHNFSEGLAIGQSAAQDEVSARARS